MHHVQFLNKGSRPLQVHLILVLLCTLYTCMYTVHIVHNVLYNGITPIMQ